MKRKLYYSMIALFFAAVSFTACEDVPAPYDIPTYGSSTTGDYYLNEKFSSGFGSFTVQTVTGTSWIIDYSTATGTGYDSTSGSTTESQSYLISPAVDLTDAEQVYLQFDYIYRYGTRSGAVDKVYITSNYTGDATTTAWTDITGTLTEGADWTTFSTYAVDIPSEFIGQSNVVVALYFACTTSSATWEVKNLIMADGTAAESGDEGETTLPEGLTGSGTADDPYTVADAISIISVMSSSAETDYIYVKGIVCSITEIDTGSYGNATYYISDDGTTANELCIYRGYYLDNAKFTSSDAIKVGDEVVIYGKFVNYYGNTPEAAQGSNYIYSINGVGGSTSGDTTGTAEGSGTVDDPYNVAKAIELISALSSSGTIEGIYVKGIVSSVTEISTSYGNGTYYISDDGTTANQLCIYRGYYLNNDKFTSTTDLEVGDEVVVYGDFVNYYGNTPEGSQGNTYVYSIVKGDGTSSGGTTSSDQSLSINGDVVTLTNTNVTAGTETATIDLDTFGLTNAETVTGPFAFSDGSTVTFDKGTGTTAQAYYTATKGIRVYACNTMTFSCSKEIASIVMTCDTYNGTIEVGNDTATVEFTSTGATYCNYNSTGSGGTQLRVQTITITYAQ
ncbi:MAG: hypothetical protein LUC22_00760 [Prevotella sp.]|nr:hypothetical protein [Prevotella sp.]